MNHIVILISLELFGLLLVSTLKLDQKSDLTIVLQNEVAAVAEARY